MSLPWKHWRLYRGERRKRIELGNLRFVGGMVVVCYVCGWMIDESLGYVSA